MQNTVEEIPDRLKAVRQRIESAALAAGREPDSVQLLAVSKKHPVAAIRMAAAAGQLRFGENYVSEALDKIAQLQDLQLQWHFIGPLQSNKTRSVAEHFHWVHSVDRVKLAVRLNAQRPPEMAPLDCCIQVNIGGEESKSGVPAGQAAVLARQFASLPRLRLRGLMTIPPPGGSQQQQRRAFAQLANLRLRLEADGMAMDTLSMGMSDDLEAAISEGATLVRIGTALFGPRPQ